MSDEGGPVEGPEVHAHAHHGTGIRWVDISLALAALFTSVVSLAVAVEHGRDMSKLVQANSVPYLQIEKADVEPDLKTEGARISISNQGVGPARIADLVITVDGKPVPDLNTLVDHCCALGMVAAGKSGAKGFDGIRFGEIFKSSAIDRMVRPGERFDLIDWRQTSTNIKPVRTLLEQFGKRISLTICYCSVFDECWVRAYKEHKPRRVKECPISPVPYDD